MLLLFAPILRASRSIIAKNRFRKNIGFSWNGIMLFTTNVTFGIKS